jgi:hypothetical protein
MSPCEIQQALWLSVPLLFLSPHPSFEPMVSELVIGAEGLVLAELSPTVSSDSPFLDIREESVCSVAQVSKKSPQKQ